MKKQYKTDPNLVEDVQKDTEKIEKKYRQQQKKKRKKREEKENLSQRWFAPFLLIVTLFVGWLVTLIF